MKTEEEEKKIQDTKNLKVVIGRQTEENKRRHSKAEIK
jgi:hypothetical protein